MKCFIIYFLLEKNLIKNERLFKEAQKDNIFRLKFRHFLNKRNALEKQILIFHVLLSLLRSLEA